MSSRGRRVSELLAAGGIPVLHAAGADPVVGGVCLDSRHVRPGDLFLALPGSRVEGDDFAQEACSRGAGAVLSGRGRPAWAGPEIGWIQVPEPRSAAGRVSREFFDRPDERLCLVGITGTNGKTTVSYLVESIAGAAGRKPGRIGTVSHAYGGAERPAGRTTPEAPDFFGLLAAMSADDVEVVSAEVSSHALALGRVEGARFRVGALVNFGRDHLDFHGDPDSYFEAKARLFEGLAPGDVAVLPADDPAGRRLAARTRASRCTFGRTPGADVRLRDEKCTPRGSTAVLETDSGPLDIRTALPGRLNLDNVAAAAACALAIDCTPESVRTGVAGLDRVPGRLESVDCGQPFSVWVDFAHTPEALARLLASVRELATGRVLVVFGCGGERDRGKRPEMGRLAAEGADLVFLTSDNPRGEDPGEILEEVASGARAVVGWPARCRTIVERREALVAAVGEARAGDAVVIAGKGHETTQSFADRVESFDDREAAQEALAALGWKGGRRADS